MLRDTPNLSYVQPEGNYYFKTSYQILKSCSINIPDCLKSPGTCDSSPCITTCKIKTDKNNTCKTCGMLITSPEFTSNLTGKTYYTKSFDSLDCSTKNVIYGIECALCGLLYVGETRQALRSRMNQHRYDARDPKYRILYNHFNQPGHDRCLTIKVRIIERIYHHTNFLSSPGCSEINVMNLFYTNPRAKRSHGHQIIQHPNVTMCSKPRPLQCTCIDLLYNIQKPLGIHHIRTILFSLPVTYLKDLRNFGLDKGCVDPFSPKYRLSSVICDVASFRLSKPVRSEPLHENNRNFLHIPLSKRKKDNMTDNDLQHITQKTKHRVTQTESKNKMQVFH